MAELRFNKTHEWALLEGDIATVGISDYAQHQLGDIVFVELPAKGQKIAKGARLGTVESTKTASEIYAPLGGEVVETNDALAQNPQWMNESPLQKGWLCKLKVSDYAQHAQLLDELSYKEFVAKEAH